MFKIVHYFEGGKSVLSNDGRFRNELMIGEVVNGRRLVAKNYKNLAAAKRVKASWNVAVDDYAEVEEA